MRGTAMGTQFAPSFSNLYIGLFKILHIMNSHQWKKDIVVYKRYIDNLLFIWWGSEEDFRLFTDYLNNNDWDLTFSGTISSKTISISLFLKLTKKSTLKTFSKKVNSNSFLDYHSCHYRKWLNNIPFGQLCRIRRNCIGSSDFKKQSKILINKLKDKKYPKPLIKAAYSRAYKLT